VVRSDRDYWGEKGTVFGILGGHRPKDWQTIRAFLGKSFPVFFLILGTQKELQQAPGGRLETEKERKEKAQAGKETISLSY
jgi:hypothetical protein